MEFFIESVPDADDVHFKLVENSSVTITGLEIKMKNKVLDELVYLSRGLINKLVAKMLPKVGAAIDEEVNKINAMIANEGEYTFVVPIMGDSLPLNLTMTHAPTTKDNLIELFFNGIFDMPKNSTKKFNFDHDITAYPPRLQHSHSEQFWLHEDTIDSLLDVAGQSMFPIMVNSEDITKQLLQIFYELRHHYGPAVKAHLGISLLPGDDKTIAFDHIKGITVGQRGEVKITIDIICSNATHVNETAVTLEMDLDMSANITMQNLIVYPQVTDISVHNTNKTHDIVGMYAHDFNTLFTQILKKTVYDINLQYQGGWPLANINPMIGMIGGLLKNTTVTPFVTDGWMYAGFEMQADLPTVPGHELEFTY